MVTLLCVGNAENPEQGSDFLYAWKSASHVRHINHSVSEEVTAITEVA